MPYRVEDIRAVNGRLDVNALINDKCSPTQGAVSGPKIIEMANMMAQGVWNWEDRAILVKDLASGLIILDGHHRYVASRVAGIEPVLVHRFDKHTRVFKWHGVLVDVDRWPGGY